VRTTAAAKIPWLFEWMKQAAKTPVRRDFIGFAIFLIAKYGAAFVFVLLVAGDRRVA